MEKIRITRQRSTRPRPRLKSTKPEVIPSCKPLYHERKLHNFIDPDPHQCDTFSPSRTHEKFSLTLQPCSWRQKNQQYQEESQISGRNFHDWEQRPMTLPSINRRLLNISGIPEIPRISRQDILNRRTSFETPRIHHPPVLRKKSSSLVETKMMRDVFIGERKDECLAGFAKASSTFLKNTSIRNTGKQSESTLDKKRMNRGSGARSVADFLTVSNRLCDMTRGMVPRASTLPKVINSNHQESTNTKGPIKEINLRPVQLREAPIYGRIRRRKLSLPAKQFGKSETCDEDLTEMRLDNSNKVGRKSSIRVGELRNISRRRIIDNAEPDGEKNKFKDYGRCGYSTMPTGMSSDSENIRWTRNPRLTTWQDVSKTVLTPKEVFRPHVSTTLPLYTKSSVKTSRIGSNIPTKIASRTLEYNRQSEGKNLRSKVIKDRTNFGKSEKSVHSRSMSDIHSMRSISPAITSSIFGFCTGKRKVQSLKKKEQGKKASESVQLKKV